MKSRAYPIGLPQVLTREQLQPPHIPAFPWRRPEDNPFRGFLQCRVLPPTPAQLDGRHTLLPYRTHGGRLTFPLCSKCAETANSDRHQRRQHDHQPLPRCRHSDSQRAWVHAYTHTELNAALLIGYRVLDVYEVWHYDEWASQEQNNSLFADYMNKLMCLKGEASGWPPGCLTQEQRDAYVQWYRTQEGIIIDPQRVQHNPGLRAVAKALLNSLWGKFAQRAERDEICYTKSAREFHDLHADPSQDVVDFVHLNEELDRCVVRRRHPFVLAPPTNNLAVASFVTAYARVYLHEKLEEVRTAGGRMLYADTDSTIFAKR